MNTAPNIDVGPWINSQAYRAAIPSPLTWLQDPVSHPSIHMICPAMMNNTECLTLWLRWHLDEAITLCTYWPPPGSIRIHPLNNSRTGGKSIQISMINTQTKWSLAVHFGYRTYMTGGVNKRKCTQSTPISPMWRATYSVSYHMVLEWRPVFPLAEMLSAGASQKPQARPFAKKSLEGSSLEPLTQHWQSLTQNWSTRTQKTTGKWTKRRRNGHCTEWPRFTTCERCGIAAKSYMLHRMNLALKTCR
jgi:hypothetical protein